MVLLLALLAGITAGYAAGGSLRALSGLRLRFETILIAAFVIQGVARGRIAGTRATQWGLWVWVIVSAVLVVLLVVNLRHPGLIVAAAGVLLNLMVVLANGGMPVVASGAEAASGVARSAGFYHVADLGTLMRWAGDAMPAGLGDSLYMLSPGDVLLVAGVATMVASAMLVRTTTEGAPQV